MKKAQVKTRRAVGKARSKPQTMTVEEYFAALPVKARRHLKAIRAAIKSEMPAEAIEVISYRIPAFREKKIFVWYAAFSEHCSLFPTGWVLKKFKDQLAGFAVSKGTVQFPMNHPVPTSLIKKLVRARVAEVQTGRKE